MGADDGLVDAPGPGLPDPPEEVDDEVVADVVPAVDVAVEVEDRAQHRRDLAGRVAIRIVGVVDKAELDGAVFGRHPRRLDPGGPGPAGDDWWLSGAGREDRRGQRQGGRMG